MPCDLGEREKLAAVVNWLILAASRLLGPMKNKHKCTLQSFEKPSSLSSCSRLSAVQSRPFSRGQYRQLQWPSLEGLTVRHTSPAKPTNLVKASSCPVQDSSPWAGPIEFKVGCRNLADKGKSPRTTDEWTQA